MSALCQSRPNAAQQIQSLFDHPLGAAEQRQPPETRPDFCDGNSMRSMCVLETQHAREIAITSVIRSQRSSPSGASRCPVLGEKRRCFDDAAKSQFDPSATCRIEVQLYHFKTADSAVHVFFWARRPSHFAKINCMSPELMMWFVLATKMAVTALFVTAATIIAERLGATV
jgi:hypothetical protein